MLISSMVTKLSKDFWDLLMLVKIDHVSEALSEHVFSFISKYAVEEKLIAQTYDGAVVMSRQHNGFQSLVRSKYENAIFVHKLNYVLKQSVEYIKDCKIFFSTLSGLSSFFQNLPNEIM